MPYRVLKSRTGPSSTVGEPYQPNSFTASCRAPYCIDWFASSRSGYR